MYVYIMHSHRTDEIPNIKHKLQFVHSILINISYEICAETK